VLSYQSNRWNYRNNVISFKIIEILFCFSNNDTIRNNGMILRKDNVLSDYFLILTSHFTYSMSTVAV
jgi:hypothetical protein